MSLVLDMLKKGAELYDIMKKVKNEWFNGIQLESSFLNVLKSKMLLSSWSA
jgi:hypothetical protein